MKNTRATCGSFGRLLSQFLSLLALASVFCAVPASPAGTLYVNLAGLTPAQPYTNWMIAATNIQDAVDAAVAGDEIVVTNGVYDTGERAMDGMRTRVVVNKAVTVRSVNGTSVTTIVGENTVPGIRCVYLADGAQLSGFTLTNGFPGKASDPWAIGSGGGVCCASSNTIVSNCVLVGNSALSGGGAYRGTLVNCALNGNVARYGAGAYDCNLTNCMVEGNFTTIYYGAGGGVEYGTLDNCTLKNNYAKYGGGANSATLNNCLLVGNSAAYFGGGAYFCALNNCTLAGNAVTEDDRNGGGASACTLRNCISYYNSSVGPGNENYDSDCTLSFTCAFPLAAGPGNRTEAPLFVDTNSWNDLRLQAASPCINAGTNAGIPPGNDLGGNPRVFGGTVDMGAYEYQGTVLSDFARWLAGFGLRTDGSCDYLDSDQDGMNNWQEWIAGTNPTNSTSVLSMLSVAITNSGFVVTWSSETNRSYILEHSAGSSTAGAFIALASNIAGLAAATSWTDTDTTNAGPRFYRVQVQR